MNLCTSVFVYVGSIGLYKRIVNADTQNIRIANAEGQRGFLTHRTTINHTTRGKPLRLQKLSFLIGLAKLGTPLES